jgi:hypothetical protein
MAAAEDMNNPVAADDIRNGIGRLSQRLRLLIFNPLENSGYSI